MTRASTPTLLSLDRFARILGINPVHFSGAVGSAIWPANGACQDIWPQYSWQTSEELIGREDVALTIATAEEDIKHALGYSLAPQWEVDEGHAWTAGRFPSRSTHVQTGFGMVIAPGQRAATAIESGATVVYSDPDGDGWNERATVTVVTDATDAREIKVFSAGMAADPAWEIRTPRSIVLAAGVATIVLDAWLLLDPDLWEQYPTNEEWQGFDVTDAANFVSTVDVYRVYNDTAAAGATFYTGDSCALCGGGGCTICGGSAHAGCFSVVNARLGYVNPIPAVHDGSAWRYSSTAICQPIRSVHLHYYAGMVDKQYAAGRTLEPLSQYFAEAIAWLAAARLPSSICNCNNIRERVRELQRDASLLREGDRGSLYTRFESQDIFHNPFGTRVGEVKAWQRLVRLVGEVGGAVAL